LPLIPKNHLETINDLPISPDELVWQCALACGSSRAWYGAGGTFIAATIAVSQSVPALHVHHRSRTKGDGFEGIFLAAPQNKGAEEIDSVLSALRGAMRKFESRDTTSTAEQAFSGGGARSQFLMYPVGVMQLKSIRRKKDQPMAEAFLLPEVPDNRQRRDFATFSEGYEVIVCDISRMAPRMQSDGANSRCGDGTARRRSNLSENRIDAVMHFAPSLKPRIHAGP